MAFVQEPGQQPAGPIGRITCKPARLQTECLFGSFEHRMGCRDLVVGARRRRFYVEDDGMPSIDQIVEAIAELNAFVCFRGPGGTRVRRPR